MHRNLKQGKSYLQIILISVLCTYANIVEKISYVNYLLEQLSFGYLKSIYQHCRVAVIPMESCSQQMKDICMQLFSSYLNVSTLITFAIFTVPAQNQLPKRLYHQALDDKPKKENNTDACFSSCCYHKILDQIV